MNVGEGVYCKQSKRPSFEPWEPPNIYGVAGGSVPPGAMDRREDSQGRASVQKPQGGAAGRRREWLVSRVSPMAETKDTNQWMASSHLGESSFGGRKQWLVMGSGGEVVEKLG